MPSQYIPFPLSLDEGDVFLNSWGPHSLQGKSLHRPHRTADCSAAGSLVVRSLGTSPVHFHRHQHQQHARAFSLLTFNINSSQVSESAPKDWSSVAQQAQLLKLVLSHFPDVLCLQEADEDTIALFSGHYHLVGKSTSHNGLCLLFLRTDSRVRAVGSAFRPCTGTVVVPVRVGNRRFYLCGGHLKSQAGNEEVRAQQLAALVNAVPSDVPLVFCGDTNMREYETAPSDNGLLDAWREDGAHAHKYATWNTHVNRYYLKGGAYKARYDRVLMREARVLSFTIVGDKPCSDNPEHFISDHFAICAAVEIE